MNLPAECALVLRRRSSWEAADAGVLLWRGSFAYFIPFFALPIWIAAFGIRLLPEFLHPWSYLILWWLKPFFDRFALHVVSIRFFEPQAGMGRFFRGLGRHLVRGLVGDLLWRRFSPWRVSRMPVRLLEGLRGKSLRQRTMLLARGGLDFCFLLTALGLILETGLFVSELYFSWSMAGLIRPDLTINLLSGLSGTVSLFCFVVFCFNLMLVESLYVCMGFGLYINSRVEVEGWDIQLLFQNFTEQKPAQKTGVHPLRPEQSHGTGRSGPTVHALVLALLYFMLVLLSPLTVAAQSPGESIAVDEADTGAVKVLQPGPRQSLYREDVPSFSYSTEAPLEDLKEILASRDFGGEDETWGIRLKNQREDGEPEYPNFPSWMEKIRQAAAYILRLLLALAALGAVIFLLYRYAKFGPKFRPSGEGLSLSPSLSPEENPAVLFDLAGELYHRGQIRESWAACLAGTIAAYSQGRGLLFPQDATEYDCLALVRAAEKEAHNEESLHRVTGFERLIRRWVRFAYAGLAPAEGDFGDSLGFGRSLLAASPGEEAAGG